MSDAEIAHLVASRLIMLILTFSDSTFFFYLGGGDSFHSCLSFFLYLQGGYTPLHRACANSHEKIVEMLVTAGSDVKVEDWVRRRLTVRLGLSCLDGTGRCHVAD